MSTQTSTVIPLFAQNNSSTHNQHTPSAKLYELPLQAKHLTQQMPTQKPFSWLASALVLFGHILAIYLLVAHQSLDKVDILPAKPMMVSLIAPPAPQPELVPVIEPPKPLIQPKPIVKKVVEKIRPIEKPTERLVEAAVEQPVVEEEPTAQPVPAQVADVVKMPPKSESIVEDKIEPPRFGVAYLNNPAPDYPPMSRRLGEEGRVLMKVLVSAEGSASDVQIEKSSGSDRLDKAAISAVKQWRFIPAKKNNQPLSAYVLVPIKFSLDN